MSKISLLFIILYLRVDRMFSGRFLHTTKVRAKNSKLSLAPSPEDEVVHLKSPAESVYFPLTYPDMFLLQNLEHELQAKTLRN